MPWPRLLVASAERISNLYRGFDTSDYVMCLCSRGARWVYVGHLRFALLLADFNDSPQIFLTARGPRKPFCFLWQICRVCVCSRSFFAGTGCTELAGRFLEMCDLLDRSQQRTCDKASAARERLSKLVERLSVVLSSLLTTRLESFSLPQDHVPQNLCHPPSCHPRCLGRKHLDCVSVYQHSSALKLRSPLVLIVPIEALPSPVRSIWVPGRHCRGSQWRHIQHRRKLLDRWLSSWTRLT